MDAQHIESAVQDIATSPEYQGLAGFVALIERRCRPRIVARNLRAIKVLFRLVKMTVYKKMRGLGPGDKMKLYRAIRQGCPAFSKSFTI